MLRESTGTFLLDEMKQKEITRYNSKDVFEIKNELKNVNDKIEEIKQIASTMDDITEELSVNFALLKAYKDRLLRVSTAYHFHRFIKIQESFFKKENIKENLSLDEVELLKSFSEITNAYLQPFKHLNLGDRHPPLDFYIQIMTLEDCGAVLCENEFVDLKKDRIYFLKKSDVAHLLKKNMAKVI